MQHAVLAASILLTNVLFGQSTVIVNTQLMGQAFSFTAVHDDSLGARIAIDSAIAEVERIEALISEWQEGSETSLVNRHAGEAPVTISRELLDLINRSIKVSTLTDGAFDITFLGAYHLWTFDRKEHALPDSLEVNRSIQYVGFRRMVVNEDSLSVSLPRPGMKIGFGGIGQGYAANRAKEVMVRLGISNGLVNASGDIMAWGTQADGKPWQVGIGDPENPDRIIAWLDVNDMAVTTAGDYEKFFTNNGRRYAHIVDPRFGWPVTGIKSVTVFCADAELADALDTAVFVLGREKGLELINALDGVECLIMDENSQMFRSEGLEMK